MIIDMNYWTKVFRKLLIFIISVFGIYLSFKLAIFYIPFLIAFIISLIIEPIIKFCMKKYKLKRKTSALIVFSIVLIILITFLVWGIATLVSESSNLLNSLNNYVEKISNGITDIISKIDLSKFKFSNEIMVTLQNSGNQILNEIANGIKNILTELLNIISFMPTIVIYTIICILSLYFICVDKIYMIDQLEHHFPEVWVKKATKHIKNITKSLGNYLKAEAILVFISFVICLIGLCVFNLIGLDVKFPLIAALVIGFVDALPIFGSSSVMIPWAVISAFNGDIKLAIALLILLTIMAISRQLIEPKIVSGKIGIHPIFTLIAMYTGFKITGLIGLFVGPITLIILKNIYANMIDKGFAKSIFEREI